MSAALLTDTRHAELLAKLGGRAEILRVVCAWCNCVEREGTPGAATSHSVCPTCLERVMSEEAV